MWQPSANSDTVLSKIASHFGRLGGRGFGPDGSCRTQGGFSTCSFRAHRPSIAATFVRPEGRTSWRTGGSDGFRQSSRTSDKLSGNPGRGRARHRHRDVLRPPGVLYAYGRGPLLVSSPRGGHPESFWFFPRKYRAA